MKKVIIAIGVVALLAAGTAAFAHGWGYGPGYGGHMWGGGPGMMGGYGYADEDAQKFLQETADLRRQLHEKRFELREAYRLGDKEKAEAIEKDLDKLYGELSEKGGFEPGSRRGYGSGYGHGPRAGYGPGYCAGPRGW